MSVYTTAEFTESLRHNRQSAQEVAPFVFRLVQPRSVIDVGCGLGVWLESFQKLGATDILGVDGDYIDPAKLFIPQSSFMAHDLSRPLNLTRQFDLVVSLEVAEHLASVVASDFIGGLASAGPVVLFSAAIPFQGGTCHLNEQWPDYWAELFQRHGFVAIDCIRKQFWSNKNVTYYYKQNMLLYVKKSYLDQHALLQTEFTNQGVRALAVVHPEQYERKANVNLLGLRTYLRQLPRVALAAFKRRIDKYFARK